MWIADSGDETGLAANDPTNRRDANAEPLGDYRERNATDAHKMLYAFSVVLDESSLSGPRPAPFGKHVSGIRARGSQEQVRRIDARRVVARMTDDEAIGDRSMLTLPCDTMSALGWSRSYAGRIAIAVLISRTSPRPATIGTGRLVNPALKRNTRATDHTFYFTSTIG